jgi:hypothetical protein
MTWVLTTTEKKSVEEYEFWTKDDVTIKRINGFRWGTVYCDDEDKPEIDLDNPDGISVFDCGYDFELDSLDDGWYCDWEFPDDMSEEERQAIIDGWDEDSYDYMESNGWYNSETETWFFGQLSLEEQ